MTDVFRILLLHFSGKKVAVQTLAAGLLPQQQILLLSWFNSEHRAWLSVSISWASSCRKCLSYSQILTCLSSTSTHVNIPLFNSQTKECKKLSCFGLYRLPLVKANTVATLSYLQVTGLQSSVFLNLPHHCLEKRKCLLIRVKKNVLAASETTAL